LFGKYLLANGMTAAYTLSDRDFPREFSRFANFVGPAELQEAVNRVSTKLGPLPSSMLALYLDRYFFHTECIALSEGPNPFQLDVSDPNAVRFASFIAGVNRMKASLSASGASRFKRTILGMLRPDRDIRQLEHEVRVYTHLGQKQIKTVLADLEQIGQFDMLCDADGKQFEVECKTITENTGEQIKTDLLVGLSEMFHKTLLSVDAIAVSGIYILTLSKSPDLCGNLHLALRNALLSSSLPLSTEDFTLSFVAKPDWNDAKTVEIVIRDLEAQSHRWFGARFGNKMLGLVLRPHKPNNLSEKIVQYLKGGGRPVFRRETEPSLAPPNRPSRGRVSEGG
jgi:hypothetical protein